MSLKLAGKNALVTGASEGIGRAVALDLAANGAFVILNARSASNLDKVVEEIQQKGGKAVAIAADVSKLADIKLLFEQIPKLVPSLDIVVHSAGISEFSTIQDATEEHWDRIFNLNTKGAFFVLQAAAKIVADGGKIITLSTIGTKRAVAGFSVYFASKGALEQITRTLALEVAPRKISVNIVSPGPTLTKMLPEAYHESVAELSPFKRLGVAEDIAGTVTFLASPDSSWITGQNIQVNGGIFLAN